VPRARGQSPACTLSGHVCVLARVCVCVCVCVSSITPPFVCVCVCLSSITPPGGHAGESARLQLVRPFQGGQMGWGLGQTDCNRLQETARDCSFRQEHYSCECMPGSAEWLVVVSGLHMLNLFTSCSFGLACCDTRGRGVVYFSPMGVCVCTEVVIAHKMFACLPARTTPARCPGRGWRRRTLR
jgi:hypothetical protein